MFSSEFGISLNGKKVKNYTEAQNVCEALVVTTKSAEIIANRTCP